MFVSGQENFAGAKRPGPRPRFPERWLLFRQVIHFEPGSQSGYTSSTAMTSRTISPLMSSCMHAPAGQKQGRMIWRWRSRPAKPAMNGSGSGAFMAARSTLMATKRTFQFAGMQESNEDWTISQ